MTRRLAVEDGPREATDSAIRELAASGSLFWLDIEAPTPAERALVLDVLGITDPALDGLGRMGRRPALEDCGGHALVVAYGGAPEPDRDRLVEVHGLVTPTCLVTLHDDPCPSFAELLARPLRRHPGTSPAGLLHRALDALVVSLMPLIAGLDARGDELADMVLDRGGDVQREILDTRRRLIGLRRIVLPQRDLLGRLAEAEDDEVPGMTRDVARRFRGSYERMVRVGDALDGAREAAQAATDVYLGTINNRLNTIMKQLTVIAGIFLPLSFITGFFGQNFPWMVDHLGGPGRFLVLGVGLQVLTVVVLVLFFRRRRWL